MQAILQTAKWRDPGDALRICARHLETHNCQLSIGKLSTDLKGPTGFDSMRNDVSKHAGSWDESLKR